MLTQVRQKSPLNLIKSGYVESFDLFNVHTMNLPYWICFGHFHLRMFITIQRHFTIRIEANLIILAHRPIDFTRKSTFS